MKKRKNMQRIIKGVFLLIASAVVLPLVFQSCQQDELFELSALNEGEEGDGMIVFSSIESTVVFPEVFVGPATFYPAKGRVQTQTVTLPNPDHASFQRTFALVIQNGDGGSNTVQSVSVYVNGTQEFSSQNLRRNPLVITQLIYDLGEFTTIDVEVKGKDGSYVTVWIEGMLTKSTGTFTDDRDGRQYKTVTLGSQTWMAENMAYLPEVSSLMDPSQDPRYYVHGYTGESVVEAKATQEYQTYGVLYNWGAAMTTACPTGWRLPSEADYNNLGYYLEANGFLHDGAAPWSDHYAKTLADELNWNSSTVEGSPGCDPDLNNSSGFSALPGAGVWIDNDDYRFYELGQYGLWWTSTLAGGELQSRSFYLFYHDPVARFTSLDQTVGAYSVRCIKE